MTTKKTLFYTTLPVLLSAALPAFAGEPTAPGNLTPLVYSSTAAELLWQRSTDDGAVLGYEIRRNDELIATVDALSFFEDSLAPNTQYNYAVVAIDNENNRSTVATTSLTTNSDNDSSTGQDDLNLSFAVYSSSAIELFWDRSGEDITAYEIFKNSELVASTDGTSYFTDSLAADTEYTFEVVGVTEDGQRSTSSGVMVRTNGTQSTGDTAQVVGTVANLTVDVYSQTAAELFWDRAPELVETNEVLRDGVVIGNTDGTSFFDSDRSAGQAYNYTVNALNAAGEIVATASLSDSGFEGTTGTDTGTSSTTDVDPTLFVGGALASDPTIVGCTLSDGTETTCYEIITVGVPADSAVGPFCPETIYSSADDSGIWLDGSGVVYQANGDFILDLPNIYGDSTWHLYDEDGNVNITDTQEACEAAARPDVDEAYTNHCVECSLDYVDGGVSATYLIPVTPTPADSAGAIANVGVTLNGVQLAGPAPVDAILSAYTIAAFDDCGGHVNPTDGYHYHAATGCTEEADTQSDGHASMIGYAMDGYRIYGLLDSDGNETEGLDECRGISDDTRGYHYHAASAGENMFIGCFTGKTAASDDGRPAGPGGPPE